MNYQSIYENIKIKLQERLQEFKESDDNFFICDRVNDIGYLWNFKESLYTYADGTILLERLYFGESVDFIDKEVFANTEEVKGVYNELIEYTNSLPDINTLSDDEKKEIEAKIEQYQEQIINDTKKESIKVPFFETPTFNSRKLLLTRLGDLKDQELEVLSSVMADFVISFFRNTVMLDLKNDLFIRGVTYNDYVDIVAQIKEE